MKTLILGILLNLVITNVFAELIAYYPFNGNALDESGQKHDGKLINIALTEDRFAIPRKAYQFNGDSYINVENAFAEEDFNGVTIALWLYPNQNDTVLLAHTQDMGLLFDKDNSLWFYSVIAKEAITKNEWQHLVASIDQFGNVDLYKNGLHIKGGSSEFMPPSGEQVIFGGSLVGKLDDIRVYNNSLSEAEVAKIYNKEKPTTEELTKKHEGTYEEGYQAGRRICINNPESCGLKYPAEEDDYEDDENEEDPELSDSNSPLLSSSKNVILSIPLAAIGDTRSIGTELIRDSDPITGEIVFRLRTNQETANPLVWNIKINPTIVKAGDAQLISWQSRQQVQYHFYLYDINNNPINTYEFLSESCQQAGSNGIDGCLGRQNSTERLSDSWIIPSQLRAGNYKIKVMIWQVEKAWRYSPVFKVQ